MNYCECGCGQIVKKRFVHNHHVRVLNPSWSVETREKQSFLAKERFRLGIQKRMIKELHPAYRHIGEKYLRPDGYLEIKISDSGKKHIDWVLEHRYVMEKNIKRKLSTKESVHHINGIRTDNRLENLAITNGHDHEQRTLIGILQGKIIELEEIIKHKENAKK